MFSIISIMLSSIEFNNELCSGAIEISDVIADDLLSIELKPFELFSPYS